MSRPRSVDGIVFRKRDVIGANDAEYDTEWLENCFIDNGVLDVLQDLRSPQRIILGRTGAGKSALLMMMAQRADRVAIVDPAKLSLSYVSNSPILAVLRESKVNLEFFYKLLWKHCFCVELLRLHFGQRTWFEQFRDSLTNGEHKRALSYVEEFGDTFFDENEVRVRTLVQKLEQKLGAELEAKVPRFSARVEAGDTFSVEERAEIARRAPRVLPDSHRQELAQIVDVVDAVLRDPQKPYYVLVDKIDENWIQESEKLPLLMALLETVKELKQIRHAKVIVATRVDLLRRVFDTCHGIGFQEEKYESLFLRLTWAPSELRRLLEERVNFTFKDRYSSTKRLVLQDLFLSDGAHFELGEFIVDRTLRRPRDVISFFNELMEASDGQTSITRQRAEQAEKGYSESRLRSLRDEWADSFPKVDAIARILLDKQPSSFRLGDLLPSVIRDRCIDYAVQHSEPWPDGVAAASNGDHDARLFVRKGVAIMCHIGVVTLKVRPDEVAASGPENRIESLIPALSEDTRVTIHPMLARVLHVRPPH